MRGLLPAGVDIVSLGMDTAVAAYLLDPSSGRYGLEDVVDTQLGIALDAGAAAALSGQLALGGEGGDGGDGESSTAERAARQAAALVALVGPMRAALEQAGLARLHDEVERPLVRVLARMEVVGIKVDAIALKHLADELAGEAARLEAEIHQLAGEEFNVNSTPQLRTVLYERLGFAPGRKTKTGFSTDAATLERLRGEHPIVDALLRYREVEKLRSTYGETLLAEIATDGRIHASFNQTVARTGRLSSDRPNLHNIPVRTEEGRKLRRVFVPEDGCRLLIADYDQIELRVLAHVSGDPGLVSAFAEGRDIHRATAARVFGVAPEEVTVAQRSRAKMVSYGLAYGMEAYGLGQRLAIETSEAARHPRRLLHRLPGGARLHGPDGGRGAARRATPRPLFGRRRPLPDLHSPNRGLRMAAERQAMNAGIQGLAADLFKVALVHLDRASRRARPRRAPRAPGPRRGPRRGSGGGGGGGGGARAPSHGGGGRRGGTERPPGGVAAPGGRRGPRPRAEPKAERTREQWPSRGSGLVVCYRLFAGRHPAAEPADLSRRGDSHS